MAVTEQARHRLYKYFEETMGEERAATMMELLPPVGWGDVAMKTDVAGVKTDVAALKTDVAGLKTDVAGLKTDVAALKTDVARIEQRMEREMVTKAEFERGLRTMLATVIATNVALLGIAVGAVVAIVG